MLYQDAVLALMDGMYVTRESWKEDGSYLVYLPRLTHFLRITSIPDGRVNPWAPNVEESTATDWKLQPRAGATLIEEVVTNTPECEL